MTSSKLHPPDDGFIYSVGTNFNEARAGTYYTEYITDSAGHLSTFVEWSSPYYICAEALMRFDTSSIGDDEVSAVTLHLRPHSSTPTDGSPVSLDVYASNFGAGLSEADWVAGSSFSGMTKVASVSAAVFSGISHVALTSEAAFKTAINGAGYTDLVFILPIIATGTPAPTGLDGIAFVAGDVGIPAEYLPYLIIEHSAAPSGLSIPVAMHHYRTLRR